MVSSMTILEAAALTAAILGPMTVITVAFTMLLSRQIRTSEQRIINQIRTSEQGFSRQIRTSEQRLTEQYRETNRDTKTLIRDVAFLQGSVGIAPGRQESDTDGKAETAD